MKSNIIKSLGIFLLSVLVLSACRNEDNLIEPTCFDEVCNQGELRVDCGGPNCAECPPSCEDNIANQDEQSPESLTNPAVIGIDCGGEICGDTPCATCDDGVQNAHWVRNINLTSEDLQYDSVGQDLNGNLYMLVWESGIDCGYPCPNYCEVGTQCDDGIQNGDEEGIDCGGTCGTPCPAPSCTDGIQNGTETGIDCGDAPEPSICGECPDPSCSDGIQNIHIEYSDEFVDGYMVVVETGIDCDGNPFTACPDCPIYTCFDGVQNGTETGIDCGGSCLPTMCDPDPNCNNGIMDGTETGVDCDADPLTSCPPCALCGPVDSGIDGIKNGPEFDVDCVDYPIAEYPCPVCPSCHDEVMNTILLDGPGSGMYENDVDCGGPDCDLCLQELTVDNIGSDEGQSPFRDQYSYNVLLATSGQDTLELDHNNYPGLSYTKVQSGITGPAYLLIEANQGIMTADLGIFMRTVELYIPWPESMVTVDLPYMGLPPATMDMIDSAPAVPGGCTIPFTNLEVPFLIYKEELISNPGVLSRCFFSYVDGTSTLSIDYLMGHIEYDRYVKGNVDEGAMLYTPLALPGVIDVEGSFTNLQFKKHYPFLL